MSKCHGGLCLQKGAVHHSRRRMPKMPGHSSWKGYLKISLVSVPVKAYTATKSAATISLNQLHAACYSSIQYQKNCPIYGEVPNADTVSGYEYTIGQYVVIDTD